MIFNKKPDLTPSEKRHRLQNELKKGDDTVKSNPKDFMSFSMPLSHKNFLFKLISKLKHH